ncbi:TPA: chromosome segregation protein SMC [Candidatus Micrarchaeota archaeon]|nr:chromosome segregation protein SMC [Candidatus Micrarchaeota archaeon]
MFVKELTLKNFKSFKSASLNFNQGFNCIVGPNGSGKSNTIDSLLFAFGENSLRSMRVKKISDLIFQSSGIAEVSLVLEDAEKGKHEIRRAVRRDGKVKYMLDGKRAKKYVVTEFLAQNALSTQNIIKQGEVQRIVEMNPRDRRTLIDVVANVSEYEQKKNEAFRELETVQERLREANAILSEREGYLKALEKEKDDAQKYISLKKQLDEFRASLLLVDIKVMSREFESALAAMLDSQNKADAARKSIVELEQSIAEKHEAKEGIHALIMQRSEGKQLILEREVQELHTSIEKAKTLIEEKKAQLQKSESRTHELKLELMRAGDEVSGATSRMKEGHEEVAAVQKIYDEEKAKYDRVLKDSDSFSQQFHDARTAFEKANGDMQSCKDELNALQAQVSVSRETARMKQDELERLKAGDFVDYSGKKEELAQRRKLAQKEFKDAEASGDELFKEEKRLNEEIRSWEQTLLRAKEKIYDLSNRLKHGREFEVSRSLQAVLEMQSKDKGIYGTLEQLCSYDPKYAVPVQVAMGPRANYVVVDSFRTASKTVEFLKQNRLGRVSFIPLDKIHGHKPNAEDDELRKKGGSNALGFLIDFVEYDEKYARAFQYAFGSTVLMKALAPAEPLVGKIRFVTMDGDIAESSGLLTGGNASERINVLKVKAELDEWDKKAKSAEESRKAVLNEMEDLREKMSGVRKSKAEAELRLKAIEIEAAHVENEEKRDSEKQSNISSAIARLRKEVKELDAKCADGDEQRTALIKRLSELNIFALEQKEKIDFEKEKNYGISLKEKEKRLGELKIRLSELQNQLASLQTQHSVYEKQFNSLRSQQETAEKEDVLARNAIEEADALIKENTRAIREKQAELKTVTGALKDLYEQRESLEKHIAKLGNQKGDLQFKRERFEREYNEFNVNKVRIETNLANSKAEYAEYEGIEIPNADALSQEVKPELMARARSAEEQITSLGAVNLRAVEEYGTRSQEFAVQKQRVKQLFEEREAVISMINEIEGKKINTFMQTFDFVNENFKRLFSQVFRGNGSLFLENKTNPFEGGLTIEANLEGKEVKYLELMSGGEKSLIALMFIFAIQSHSPFSIYILDEADAALDHENSRKLAQLLKELSKNSQFLVVSHNQNVYRDADTLVGVAMTKDGSKLVQVKLNE